MTREIKFRAWDNQFNIWVDDSIIDRWAILVLNLGSIHTIEQYTGLKDKNGTEVYEGDIVQRSDNETCFQVAWNMEGATFRLSPQNKDLPSQPMMFTAVCKVIGNIHEHKHLLNKGE